MAECIPPLDETELSKKDKDQGGEEEELKEVLETLKTQGTYVKLNVGGCLYYTTIGTLTKHDSMLRAMFSGRMQVQSDAEGWVLVDRSGKHFGVILNYLRDGSVSMPDNRKECLELLAEAKYYLIDDLVEAVEKRLMRLKEEHQPLCLVPVITSLEEAHQIVSTSSKPVIKLLYNRGNNKYSYTSNSDDNLLKNIELFDKLSVRLGSRISFIKDIVGRGEICCWTFYGHGKKVAEICCESIVYATDRKHTKIEFPEAKILDETLNIMLYEKRLDEPQVVRTAHIEPTSRTRRRTPENFLSE